MEGFSKWSCFERSKMMYTFGNNDVRRWYQRDIDQIVHSTAFRKLQKKSQLLSENDPRSRSRLIHTIEVSRIALEICEKLVLVKELAEAISLGHDIATSPYGFVGNDFLRIKTKSKSGKVFFTHEEAGEFMIQTIAQKRLTDEHMINSAANVFSRDKKGLKEIIVNDFPYKIPVSCMEIQDHEYAYFGYFISPEVIDGIKNHGSITIPNTLEGQVVCFSDNIAYLSQDLDDLMYSHIISSPVEYTRFEAENTLCYKDKCMEWSKIDEWEELEMQADTSLKGVFNRSRGIRIATLISRFVNYNLKLLEKGKLSYMQSSILDKEIPKLQIDNGLQFVLDFLWEFVEGFYSKTLIKTSNNLQKARLQQVWNIIQDNDFQTKNNSYANFARSLNDSRFFNKSKRWKNGYFISHLSCSDVDTIISSFHRRDYTFEIDLDEGGNENN